MKQHKPLLPQSRRHIISPHHKAVLSQFYRYTRKEKQILGLGLSVIIFLFGLLFIYENFLLVAQPEAEVPQRLAAHGSTDNLAALLTRITSDDETRNSHVVVLAANYAYRDLALNFACNLRRLKVSNYIFFALDEKAYIFLRNRGINVFYHGLAQTLETLRLENKQADSGEKEAVFGTRDFIHTSQLKSRLVLEILRLNYDVLFSDVDVFWLQDPVSFMSSFKEDVIIQSDAKSHEGQALNYNLNSGLYYARASRQAVKMFGAIVKYGRKLRRSEQKAFNHVLCGAFREIVGGPGIRVATDRCMYEKAGVTVSARLLPVDMFPNGSDDYWDSTYENATRKRSLIAVHANYVQGLSMKVSKLKEHQLWLLEGESQENKILQCSKST